MENLKRNLKTLQPTNQSSDHASSLNFVGKLGPIPWHSNRKYLMSTVGLFLQLYPPGRSFQDILML